MWTEFIPSWMGGKILDAIWKKCVEICGPDKIDLHEYVRNPDRDDQVFYSRISLKYSSLGVRFEGRRISGQISQYKCTNQLELIDQPICRKIVGCSFGGHHGGYIFPDDGWPQGAFLLKKEDDGSVLKGKDLFIADGAINSSPNLSWYKDKTQAMAAFMAKQEASG